jgi:hypothetical protein
MDIVLIFLGANFLDKFVLLNAINGYTQILFLFLTFFSDIYFILIYIWFDFEFELYCSFNFCIVSMLKEKFSNHSLYIQVIQSFISLLSSLIDIISIVYQ